MPYFKRLLPLAFLASAACAIAPAQAQTNEPSPKPEASPMERVTKARKEAKEKGEGDRVVGGEEAAPGAWPFQVALLSSRLLDSDPATQADAQFCGGSLISNEWVLTAAHCLVQYGYIIDPSDVTILEGATALEEGNRIPVAEIIVHDGYNPQSFDNDIGLIKLAAPATKTAISMTAENIQGGPATVTGWGRMADGGFPGTLLQADLELFENKSCNDGIKQIYARDLNMVLQNVGRRMRLSPAGIEEATKLIAASMADPLTDNMLCAGTTSGERDACNGDSGGPLFTSRSGQPVQVGIVSWGEGPLDANIACGHENAYGVYTRVANYRDWIAEKTGIK